MRNSRGQKSTLLFLLLFLGAMFPLIGAGQSEAPSPEPIPAHDVDRLSLAPPEGPGLAPIRNHPILPPAPPVIVFQDETPDTDPVVISRLKVDVVIEGGLALTKMDITLKNSSNRIRGGNLVIPLLADALIMGYQLEVEGVLIDGVPVERVQARQIFEAIQRQGIDPGLVEFAQGNAFRTRVFPIQPRQTRRLTLSYTSPLAGEKASQFELPLKMGGSVAQFDLEIQVLESSIQPQVEIEGLGTPVVQSWNKGWATKLSRQNVNLETVVKITLPQGGLDQPLLQKVGNQTWFAVTKALPTEKVSSPLPQGGITLMVDASLSMKASDHGPLLDVLKALAQREAKPVKIQAIAFRDQAQKPLALEVTASDASQVERWLNTLAWDGGTRFDNLPPPAPNTIVLFYSDANPSLGQALPAWPEGTQKALLSPSRLGNADFARRLIGPRGLVEAFGERSAEALSQALLASPPLVQIRVTQGRAEQIRQASLFGRSDRVLITGLLASDTLTLELSTGAQTSSLKIDSKTTPLGGLARFAWAQAQLQALMASSNYGSTAWKDEVRSFGLEYGIVTPGTSLLVLESLAQYIEYAIMPPATMAQWRQEWLHQKKESTQKQESDLKSRLDSLAQQWKEREEWWKKDLRNTEWKKEEDQKRASEDVSSPRPTMAEAPSSSIQERSVAEPMADRMMSDREEESDDEAKPQEPQGPRISIQAWAPDRPYLKALGGLKAEAAYTAYLKIRDEYRGSPAFFLDMGDHFLKLGSKDLAVRIWTNLSELGFMAPSILRVLGHRLDHAGDLNLAILVFNMVLEVRPDEPQSHRDLGLTLARKGEYPRATELLWTVATGEWKRTSGIELIALMEFNRYLPQARKLGFNQKIDPRLEKLMDLDLRISMAWDADLTDMDLWLTEPSGYKVYYGNPKSPHGGLISRDITDGYGPEEYMLHWAKKGEYTVETNYYGSSSAELTGAVTLFLSVWTNYGRPNEERQDIVLQLNGNKETYRVGSVKW